MCLQSLILKRHRQHYPELTLRQISKQTGIQLTRLFRLYNGYEMKLKEYELFENLLKREGHSSPSDFQVTIDLALEIFSKETIEELKIQLDRKIETHAQMKKRARSSMPGRIA